MRRRLATLALTTLGLLGCAPDDDPALARAPATIVNGEVNEGDPAVVALTMRGSSFCTGTLIRHDVVLTAAHCLPPHVPAGGYGSIDVFFGTQVRGPGEAIDVVDGWTHPGWNDNELFYDIGLIRLKRPADVDPIPFRTTPMNDEVGSRVRITGFGISNGLSQDSGIKRVGETTIVEVSPELFVMDGSPSAICSGDSGGPALLLNEDGAEEVAGVNSRGNCTQSSIETNVHRYLEPIYTFLGENPSATCEADGACAALCDAPDPDCLCATDGFCGAHCADAATDADCTTQCAANNVCNAACPDEVADPDCALLCGVADGLCDPLCTTIDPDCAVADCEEDGPCDERCGDDPGCADTASPKPLQPSGGCSLGSDPEAPLWLLVAGLVLASRRRP